MALKKRPNYYKFRFISYLLFLPTIPAILSTLSAPTFAATTQQSTNNTGQNSSDFDESNVLDPVLVTGFTETPIAASGKSYTIIEGSKLSANNTTSVAEALRQVPGLTVTQTGPLGGTTAVRIRGAESNHTKILIDGVEAPSVTSGQYDISNLLAMDIERIEVLRGPQSSFYGSNALAGVINIITKSGVKNQWRVSADAGYGAMSSYIGSFNLSGGGENYVLSLSAAHRQTEGYNVASTGTNEDEGDKNTTLNGKVSIDLTDQLQFDAMIRNSNHRIESDGTGSDYYDPNYGYLIDTDDWTDNHDFMSNFGLTYKALDDRLVQKIKYTKTTNQMNYYSESEISSKTHSTTDLASYSISYNFDSSENFSHTISAGADYAYETFEPQPPLYDPSQKKESRENTSFVGEYKVDMFNQFHITAGLRYDSNDDFDDVTTYNIASSWSIPNSDTRLHASIGTGQTNPTFVEQFGFVPNTFVGNPDLKPETSFGYDFGVEQTFFNGALIADITYFNQNLENEIATKYLPGYTSTVYNMDGKSHRQGVEVSGTLNLTNGFSASASYTYLDSRDSDGNWEVRRPRNSGSLGAAYENDKYRVFTEAVFSGKREDSVFVNSLPPTILLPAYTTVNIGATYKFNKNLALYAKVENLFDEKYQEVFDYNSVGRAAYIGIKGSF